MVEFHIFTKAHCEYLGLFKGMDSYIHRIILLKDFIIKYGMVFRKRGIAVLDTDIIILDRIICSHTRTVGGIEYFDGNKLTRKDMELINSIYRWHEEYVEHNIRGDGNLSKVFRNNYY